MFEEKKRELVRINLLLEIFCLWFFLKQKIYILIHIQLMPRVGDKKIFTQSISRNKTILFGLKLKFKVISTNLWPLYNRNSSWKIIFWNLFWIWCFGPEFCFLHQKNKTNATDYKFWVLWTKIKCIFEENNL